MTITVPNPEVLKQAFAAIEANLFAWHQGRWIEMDWESGELPPENTCGTTACLAGFIVLGTGKTPLEVEEMREGAADAALEALGFVPAPAACRCCEAWWTDDAEDFRNLFYRTVDYVNDRDMSFTREAFDVFRAEVSELTGIEL